MASKTAKQRRAVGAMMEEGRILSKDPGRIRKKSNRRWRVVVATMIRSPARKTASFCNVATPLPTLTVSSQICRSKFERY